ncbi:MAG: mechanosensitive ion channel domain-containing protein, partial [Myxococcota bacterium]
MAGVSSWPRGAALGLLLGLAPLPAVGQEAAGEPTPLPSIPLPEVSPRAEETGRVLREVAALAARDPEIATLTEELPESRADLRHAESFTEEELAAGPTLDSLADLRVGWKVRVDALEGWQKVLGQRSVGLEEQSARLAESLELWNATREQARAAGAPAAVLERVDSTRTSLRETRAAVRERLAVILTLQDQVGQQREVATRALERVELERLNLRGRLLERERDPLWRAFASEAGEEPWWPAVRAALVDDYETVSRFARDRRDVLLAYLSLSLLVTLAALVVRRNSRHWAADDPRQRAVPLLRQPVASSILLAFVLAPLVLTNAPGAVWEMGLLLLLLPALVVLRELLPRDLHGTVYGLALLYTLDRGADLLSGLPLVARTLQLGESLAALGLLFWLIRPGRLRDLRHAIPLAGMLRLGTRLALVILVASVVANLLGWVQLAFLLAEGLLNSLYVGVVLYGAVRVAGMLAAVVIGGGTARRLRMVRRHSGLIERHIARGLGWLAGLAWLWITVGLFTLGETSVATLSSLLAAKLDLGGFARISLGATLAFAITLGVAVLISRLVRFVLAEEIYPRTHLDPGASHAASATLHYVLLALGLLFALGVAGVDLGRVTLLAGALGVGVGFGLQSVVNNFVSGLILLFERPIKIGDTVEVGTLLGDVTRIGIRSSTVRTFDGAEVIVPNANLVSEQVINWTLSDRQRRMDVVVGVRYGTDPERVLAILQQVAEAHPQVLRAPAPVALFRGFGDSSLDFLLRVWVARFDEWFVVQSDL